MKWILLFGAIGLAGCGSDADCSIDRDCFQGESCVDGLCIELVTANNTTANNTANNTTANNTTANNTTVNNTTANNTSSNYAELKAAYPDSACIVRALDTTCKVPDDNDSFHDYLMSGVGAAGCKSGDESNPADFTNTLEMCASETRDRYQTNLYPCDSRSFVLEVFVTPKVKCAADLYTVNVYTAGRDCSEQDDSFRCTLEADGTWHIQALVPPSISIGTANVEITSNHPGLVAFDYDLRILTRD